MQIANAIICTATLWKLAMTAPTSSNCQANAPFDCSSVGGCMQASGYWVGDQYCWTPNCGSSTISFVTWGDCTSCGSNKKENVMTTDTICVNKADLKFENCKANVCVYSHDGKFKSSTPATGVPSDCYSSPNQLCAMCTTKITVNAQDGTTCDDNDVCTSYNGEPDTEDRCEGGTCTGTPVVCPLDEGVDEECGEALCAKATGCYTDIKEGDSCNADEDDCTLDKCSPGGQCATGERSTEPECKLCEDMGEVCTENQDCCEPYVCFALQGEVEKKCRELPPGVDDTCPDGDGFCADECETNAVDCVPNDQCRATCGLPTCKNVCEASCPAGSIDKTKVVPSDCNNTGGGNCDGAFCSYGVSWTGPCCKCTTDCEEIGNRP